MSKTPENIDPQELTVVARSVLLDGLEALREHLAAITVVGAQAVYLRTTEAAIATAAYTSDGDLGIDPELLRDEPLLEAALQNAGFGSCRQVNPDCGADRRQSTESKQPSNSTCS
ncbi:hypothetical protein [Amycolatopsis sp. NPDC059021]|uniref:hypothetical protein n=1 Tax=Amycolatopsis sp. NPDC059021 TaxID=3346704 RepID=UPI00366D6CBD